MKSSVSIVKCAEYSPDIVFASTRQAIELLGGVASFVRPQSRVLVKPNLLMAKDPWSGITTHPLVVQAVIKILKEAGCKVCLGDGPSVWGKQAENIDEVYDKTGMKKLALEEGVELVSFDRRRWRGKFPLTALLDECDYLVSIPKFKTHDLTILTGAIKNLFGLVCGTYKTELHKEYYGQEDFARILVDIYQEAKPTLTVVDGIVAMEGDGPATGGKLRGTGLILAGADCAALDSVLALIMGIEPGDVLTNRVAAERGLGAADTGRIDILGERLEEAIGEPFKLPSTTIKKRIPRPVIELAKKLIRFYPKIEHANCTLCNACVDACPKKLINLDADRIAIDYSNCISCFCCQEACPNSAIRVKKSLLAKIAGL